MLKVLVCGGRDFDDAMTLGSWLAGIHKKEGIALLIEGGARGADYMARRFAEWSQIPVKTFPADWATYGKAAGPMRNQRMIDDGKPDLVVAFDGGRGTADMIGRAERAGIRVLRATKITIQ
jgi:hypothetical protein